MRLINADAFDEVLQNAQTECKKRGGNFRYGVLSNVRANLAKMPTAGGWISVKDRLPEEKENPYTIDYQEVICLLKTLSGFDVRVYKFGKGHFWNGPNEIDRYITNWMPFPEPPKEE